MRVIYNNIIAILINNYSRNGQHESWIEPKIILKLKHLTIQ